MGYMDYSMGGVYISKNESRSHFRANSYGWVYYKNICPNTWVSSMKKRPLTGQVKYWSATFQSQKKLCRLNIGMWGVYLEAMTCNVGVLWSDINLGEHFLR